MYDFIEKKMRATTESNFMKLGDLEEVMMMVRIDDDMQMLDMMITDTEDEVMEEGIIN